MSHKLSKRQFKRIKKELERDYLEEKEQRRRKRQEKLSRTKKGHRRPEDEDIEDIMDDEWMDDR
jgi:hypothetical protein